MPRWLSILAGFISISEESSDLKRLPRPNSRNLQDVLCCYWSTMFHWCIQGRCNETPLTLQFTASLSQKHIKSERWERVLNRPDICLGLVLSLASVSTPKWMSLRNEQLSPFFPLQFFKYLYWGSEASLSLQHGPIIPINKVSSLGRIHHRCVHTNGFINTDIETSWQAGFDPL